MSEPLNGHFGEIMLLMRELETYKQERSKYDSLIATTEEALDRHQAIVTRVMRRYPPRAIFDAVENSRWQLREGYRAVMLPRVDASKLTIDEPSSSVWPTGPTPEHAEFGRTIIADATPDILVMPSDEAEQDDAQAAWGAIG